MSRMPTLALALCAATLICGTALAKGPTPEELPTVEQILEKARAEKAAIDRAAAEASRDPHQEAIDAYRDGTVPLEDYTKLTAIINESKEDELQPYRTKAAQAVLQRFKAVNIDDPAVRRTRNELVLEIVDLMKVSSNDTVGLAIIDEVLKTWWRTKIATDVRFNPADKYRDRAKAWRKMRTFIANGERD